MKKVSLRELYGLRLAVQALKKFNVESSSIEVLDNLLIEIVKDKYADLLQNAAENNNNESSMMSKDTVDIINEYENCEKEFLNNLDWLNNERDREISMMLS